MKIAFSGKFRSGKDLACKYLEDKYGFQTLSFAKEVKLEAVTNFGMQGKDRKLLQSLGTFGRKVDDFYWIKCFKEDYDKRVTENIGISDLRFENEFYYLRELGFILVRIDVCKEELQKRIGYDDEFSCHESETDLDNLIDEFDFVIENNKTIDEFYFQIDRILKNN